MKKGFTLSEILITLGIVGVVAVLTVPSVMKNYRNRMYVAQLQKTYSQIHDAAQAIMNDEHVDNYYETSGVTQGVRYFLTNYFKNVKVDCQSGNNSCLPAGYNLINGTPVGAPSGNSCVQTVNGATICGFHNPNNMVTSIFVDVNGPAEPNIAGRDAFSLDLKRDGSISDYNSGSNIPGSMGAAPAVCSTSSSSIYGAACGCLTSVVQAGWKMEY